MTVKQFLVVGALVCHRVVADGGDVSSPYPFARQARTMSERYAYAAADAVIEEALNLFDEARRDITEMPVYPPPGMFSLLSEVEASLQNIRIRANISSVRLSRKQRRPRKSPYNLRGEQQASHGPFNKTDTYCHTWCWVALLFDVLSFIPALYGYHCPAIMTALYYLFGVLAVFDSGLNAVDALATVSQWALGIDWGFWQPNPRDDALKMLHGMHSMMGALHAVPLSGLLGNNWMKKMDQWTFPGGKVPVRLRTFYWLIISVTLSSCILAADAAYGRLGRAPGPQTAKEWQYKVIEAMYLVCIGVTTLGYGDLGVMTDAGKYASLPVFAVGQAAFAHFQSSVGQSPDEDVYGDDTISEWFHNCNMKLLSPLVDAMWPLPDTTEPATNTTEPPTPEPEGVEIAAAETTDDTAGPQLQDQEVETAAAETTDDTAGPQPQDQEVEIAAAETAGAQPQD
jgi:hypothetical protein